MAPQPKLDITVQKPNPYTFDLGLLLANDPNPLPPTDASVAAEDRLAAVARDGAQSLINQMLSTLPLSSTAAGVLLDLPAATTPLPREKPLPAAKEPTKWERFAARKGIKPKTREQRRAKSSQFNEATGEWEKTWGHDKGGRSKRKEEGMVPSDWVTEVNENGEPVGDKSKSSKKRRKA
ncbi:ribosomal biogenesis regulatory protein [Xylariales sp. PMI_506]|nr:ribosomal biogenesis regulatory protein [Xylariales sp. PMI_506]